MAIQRVLNPGIAAGIAAAVILSLASLMSLANSPPVCELRRKRGTDVRQAVAAYLARRAPAGD